MKVKFLTPAWIELREGSEYYEREQSGLGNRFWKEVDQHIQWIVRNVEVPCLREGHSFCSILKKASRVFRYFALVKCEVVQKEGGVLKEKRFTNKDTVIEFQYEFGRL